MAQYYIFNCFMHTEAYQASFMSVKIRNQHTYMFYSEIWLITVEPQLCLYDYEALPSRYKEKQCLIISIMHTRYGDA